MRSRMARLETIVRPFIVRSMALPWKEEHQRIGRFPLRTVRKIAQFASMTETPVGVEPTSTGLQPVAWPSGSSVKNDRMPSPGIEPGPRPSQSRMRIRHTPRTTMRTNSPARESDPALRLRRPPCARHTRGERTEKVPSPGVEPGPRPSEGRVRIRHTPRAIPVEVDNQSGLKVRTPTRNNGLAHPPALSRLPH